MMNAFTLKMIALIAMVIDHAGAAFPQYIPFESRIIGRLTFPIFVYLIAEGFRHTRNPKKFLLRLFAFAIISEIPFDLAITRVGSYNQWHVDFLNNTNIFYTLFIGGLAIFVFQQIYESMSVRLNEESSNKDRLIAYFISVAIAIFPTLGLMHLAEFLTTDYAGYGVLFVFLMYVIKPKWLRITVFAVMNVFQQRWIIDWLRAGHSFYGMSRWLMMIPATLLTVPLIIFYNGKRGPSAKWLFYIAYPAHLAVLAAIAWFVA